MPAPHGVQAAAEEAPAGRERSEAAGGGQRSAAARGRGWAVAFGHESRNLTERGAAFGPRCVVASGRARSRDSSAAPFLSLASDPFLSTSVT